MIVQSIKFNVEYLREIAEALRIYRDGVLKDIPCSTVEACILAIDDIATSLETEELARDN
jgi:hypothetical protein